MIIFCGHIMVVIRVRKEDKTSFYNQTCEVWFQKVDDV